MQFVSGRARPLILVGISSLVLCLSASSFASVVIGNFENGSLDGWQAPPGQSGNPTLSSVPGSTTTPPSNTLGDSVLQVNIGSGAFWGANSVNLVSTPDLRTAFIGASSISFDLTLIGSQLAGGGNFSGFAQSNEMTINSNLGGTFSQHSFSTAKGDSDSLNQNAGWSGMDGTRTLTYNLANFTVTDPTSKATETYQQYVAAHPELTDVRFWFVTQFGGGNAAPTGNFYFDNVVLNGVSVPEPGSFAVLALAIPAMLLRRRVSRF